MSDNYDGPQMAQKILRQQAEIERLRDQVVRLSTLVDTERSLHDAEIERLRRACQELYFDLEGDTQHFERWLEAQK